MDKVDLLFTNDRIVDIVQDTDATQFFDAFLSRILKRRCLLLKPGQLFGHSHISVMYKRRQIWCGLLVCKCAVTLTDQFWFDSVQILAYSLLMEGKDVIYAKVIVLSL